MREDEGIEYVSALEIDEGKPNREDPDEDGRDDHSVPTERGSVSQWGGYSKVPIHCQCCKAEQRRSTSDEKEQMQRLDGNDDIHPETFTDVEDGRHGSHDTPNDEIRQGKVTNEEVERASQIFVGIQQYC